MAGSALNVFTVLVFWHNRQRRLELCLSPKGNGWIGCQDGLGLGHANAIIGSKAVWNQGHSRTFAELA